MMSGHHTVALQSDTPGRIVARLRLASRDWQFAAAIRSSLQSKRTHALKRAIWFMIMALLKLGICGAR